VSGCLRVRWCGFQRRCTRLTVLPGSHVVSLSTSYRRLVCVAFPSRSSLQSGCAVSASSHGQLLWRSEYSSSFSFLSQHHLSGQLQWRFAYSSSSISLLGSIPGPSMRYPSLPRLSTSSRPTPMEDRVFFLLLCLDTLFLPHLVFGNIVASGYPTQDPLSPYEYSNRRKRKSPALLDLRNWGYTPSTE
jgi:hypothetical protein